MVERICTKSNSFIDSRATSYSLVVFAIVCTIFSTDDLIGKGSFLYSEKKMASSGVTRRTNSSSVKNCARVSPKVWQMISRF